MLRWLILASSTNYNAPYGYKWRIIYASVPAAGDTLLIHVGPQMISLISGAFTTASACLATSTNNPIYGDLWIPCLGGNTFSYAYVSVSATNSVMLVDEVPLDGD